ncbi:MAG: cytochrome c3 family protein [Thermoanaerobaculales bacterium]
MRKILIIVIAIVAAAGVVSAQTVVGTAHDLSSTGPGATTNVTRVCVFCHTPHQATAAAGQDPLWNHTVSTVANYGVYASDTMNATPTDIGGAAVGSQSVSNLCMSCHDGTVAVHSLYNEPNELGGAAITITAGGNVNATGFITGTPLLGTDLTDDHPINFLYDAALATADGGLVTPFSTAWVVNGTNVPLFAGTVQCASCHDPHDDTNDPFLGISNTGSALCTTCHIK